MGRKGSEKEAAHFGDDASDTLILFDSQVVWDVWVILRGQCANPIPNLARKFSSLPLDLLGHGDPWLPDASSFP